MFLGTALACSAGTMVIGAMCALWLRFRKVAITGTTHIWVPKNISIPEVASNIMLLSFIAICVFGQWAVFAAKRDDKRHVGIALLLTGLIGLAVINAQAAVYYQMRLPIRSTTGSAYGVMFYAITGTFLVFMIIGVVLVGWQVDCIAKVMSAATGAIARISPGAVQASWYCMMPPFEIPAANTFVDDTL